MRRPSIARLAALTATLWLAVGTVTSAQTAKATYEGALRVDAQARRQVGRAPLGASAQQRVEAIRLAKRAITQFEAVVRKYPRSGYADNALYQAAELSRLLYDSYDRSEDRAAATKYYNWLTREYPRSPLGKSARVATKSLASPRPAADLRTAASTTVPAASVPAPAPRPNAVSSTADVPSPSSTVVVPVMSIAPPAPPALQRIDRVALGDLVRFTLHVDGEPAFVHDVIEGPPRAYIDVHGVVPSGALQDSSTVYDDSPVRQVRVGRKDTATRVVLDLHGAPTISVFTLRNPYRIVVDASQPGVAAAGRPVVPDPRPGAEAPAAPAEEALAPLPAAFVDPGLATSGHVPAEPAPALLSTDIDPVAVTTDATEAPAPTPPSVNRDGTYSLARQLGLGVSRIVIDPGHGGHDPGTLLSGSSEAAIVLDVALRLERLLKKEAGLDVVLTRRTNVFVPLEQRTAIANREGADLFLSIHANASRNPQARGIETYYLSFASNPDAEAVAARENATSAKDMHNLSGIVRAIALNTKLDESRDLASLVQQALTSRLERGAAHGRGVKKAPFVVLIGAGMPSVLAEIGFLTNKAEGSLLKTPVHRQRVAEALHASVLAYRRALKKQTAVATR